MKKFIKNRVNIFDKIAFGISFIPLLCIMTMFTYYFNSGVVVNGSDISSNGMFFVIKELIGDFFVNISLFQLLILALLLAYQVYFIVNVFITKADGRKKKKKHDFGLFVLASSLCVFTLVCGLFFVICVWDFEWLLALFIGLFIEYQPLTTLLLLTLILAIGVVLHDGHFIITKGMNKYLKECESSDYKFTYKEMIVGITKIVVILAVCVVLSYQFVMLII